MKTQHSSGSSTRVQQSWRVRPLVVFASIGATILPIAGQLWERLAAKVIAGIEFAALAQWIHQTPRYAMSVALVVAVAVVATALWQHMRR